MIIPGGRRTWRVSSYSQEGNNCVEVAIAQDEVAVRDTKDREGGEFVLPPSAWVSFLEQLREA